MIIPSAHSLLLQADCFKNSSQKVVQHSKLQTATNVVDWYMDSSLIMLIMKFNSMKYFPRAIFRKIGLFS